MLGAQQWSSTRCVDGRNGSTTSELYGFTCALERSSRDQAGPVRFRQRSLLLRGELVLQSPSHAVFLCVLLLWRCDAHFSDPCHSLRLLVTTLFNGPKQGMFFPFTWMSSKFASKYT